MVRWASQINIMKNQKNRFVAHNLVYKAVDIEVPFPFPDQSFLHENVGCSDTDIINKHLWGLKSDVGCSKCRS